MISNTTDASRGQSMKSRVEARRSELEAALEGEDLSPRSRMDVLAALHSLAMLTTAGLDDIPTMTAAQLSDWLEKHKYVAMTAAPARPRGKQPRREPSAVPRETQDHETSGPHHV